MQHDYPRWRAGALLALATALAWGLLPLGLEVALTALDPWTVSWCRFVGAAVLFGLWLGLRGDLPALGELDRSTWCWLAIAAVGLSGNYVGYVVGLHLTSPAVAQTVIQTAPLMLMLAGVIALGERLTARQWLGVLLLVAGLLLFFNRRLPELLRPTAGWSLGVLIILAGAVGWACYGLAQRYTARQLGSLQTLWLLCIGCGALLTPLARPAQLLAVEADVAVATLFCVLNTVVAYGCFGLALERWQVSRVTAVTAITPLLTIAFVALAAATGGAWLRPEALNRLAILGVGLVVVGSALTALAARRG